MPDPAPIAGEPNVTTEVATEVATGVTPEVVTADWAATLPDDLKSAPAVKKFKGKDWNEVGPQILKSYVNLEKWQIPGEAATPEERAAFHRRMGVPENVTDYKITPTVPEGVPWNDTLQGQFAAFAHGEGLPPAAATRIVDWYLQMAKQGLDITTTETAEDVGKATEALKTRWGGAYQRNAGLVNRAVQEYGDAEFSTLLETVVVGDTRLGNHPVMLEFLRNYGEQRLEHGFIPGDSLLTTAQDTQSEIDKIMNDPKDAYWQGDKARLAHVRKLYAQLPR